MRFTRRAFLGTAGVAVLASQIRPAQAAPVNVAGIYRSHDPAEENYIYSHLEFLQRSKGMNLVGTVTQIEVLLNAGVDPVNKSAEIDELLRGGPIETDTRPKGVFQTKALGDLTQLIAMSRYLGYACVGLVLALVSTTTVVTMAVTVRGAPRAARLFCRQQAIM